jgi:hypothetical protein
MDRLIPRGLSGNYNAFKNQENDNLLSIRDLSHRCKIRNTVSVVRIISAVAR